MYKAAEQRQSERRRAMRNAAADVSVADKVKQVCQLIPAGGIEQPKVKRLGVLTRPFTTEPFTGFHWKRCCDKNTQ